MLRFKKIIKLGVASSNAAKLPTSEVTRIVHRRKWHWRKSRSRAAMLSRKIFRHPIVLFGCRWISRM